MSAQSLADPRFQGQWWILGLALASMLFNYILGEELPFRGVLLRRMAGVFRRWDWSPTGCSSACTTCTRSGPGRA
jgi:membrane protease YdiL (CAAX protease family)